MQYIYNMVVVLSDLCWNSKEANAMLFRYDASKCVWVSTIIFWRRMHFGQCAINHSYKFEGHLLIFVILALFLAHIHSKWQDLILTIQKTNEELRANIKKHTLHNFFVLSLFENCDERMMKQAHNRSTKNIDRSTNLLL